jgi:hypothetical protein
MGTSAVFEPADTVGDDAPDIEKPRRSGAYERADDGTRTHDLLHGKQTL